MRLGAMPSAAYGRMGRSSKSAGERDLRFGLVWFGFILTLCRAEPMQIFYLVTGKGKPSGE